MKISKKLVIPTLLGLALVSSHAASVAIVNADFESNPGGGFPQADNWDGTAQIALHASFAAANNGSLGTAFAFTQSSNPAAEQTLTTTFVTNTVYTLSAFHAYNAADDPNAIQSIGYRVGGVGSFVSLASIAHDQAAAPATWTSFSVDYTSASSGAEIGENIVIQIQSGDDGGLWIDNVSFDATAVPEPSSAILAGLGVLGLLRRRRR